MAQRPIEEIWSADRLDHLVNTDPSAALAAASDWRRAVTGDDGAEAQALTAIARAHFELGRSHQAADHIREALALAGALDERIAMSGAAILADAGDVDGALGLLDRLESAVADELAGRVATQRAYVLHQAGELTVALDHARRAEPLLRQADDRLGLLRLLVCRGLILLQQGELGVAEDDLRTSDALAAELQQTAIRAGIASNLGVVFGRGRRIPEALTQFTRADALYAKAGRPGRIMAVSELDRAEVLMHAGLVLDAVVAAGAAVRLAEPSGNRTLLGDAHLLLARAHHSARHYRSSERAAEAAEASFVAAGRGRMVSHARAVRVHAVLARIRDPQAAAPALTEAGELIGALAADGWAQLADELRVARVRTAFGLGVLDTVAGDVTDLKLGTTSRRRDAQLAGWYARAVDCAHDGDAVGAIEACKVGLDLLDDIVLEAPTLERRSAAMRLGSDLSDLAIALAVATGSAEIVLAAAEGTRARALHDELVQPGRHHPLTDDGAARLRSELAGRLGAQVLLEWVIASGEVWAVVCDATGMRLTGLGPVDEIRRGRDRAIVWLDRAAQDRGGGADGARRAMAALDAMLLGPLDLPPEAGVVVVPDGPLHALPWSGLPSLAGRSLTLAPNAQLWLQADRRAGTHSPSVGLVVGLDVAGWEVERDAVQAAYPQVEAVAGGGATAAVLREMLAERDVVHVAAHGTFRSDHPLLSTLRLGPGAASLYDVVPEQVRSRLVVLSSCEGGAQGTADGSEVLGFAAVMLARGASAVLTPFTVVGDVECAAFVAEVHERLAAGEPLGTAVAGVRSKWLNGDLGHWGVAASFTCFGAAAVTVSR